MQEPDHQPTAKSNVSSRPQITHAIKKSRKMRERIVVTVKIEENEKQKSEWPPTDAWSWRKYGQKPIKGSPYPRGYYRCSTSKGCSAKKQVERCKTDASMLIVTYTSTHNHPGLDGDDQNALATDNKKKKQALSDYSVPDNPDHNPVKDDPYQQEEEADDKVQESSGERVFECSHPQSPFMCSTVEKFIAINREDNNPFPESLEMASTIIPSEDMKPFNQTDSMDFSSLLKSDEQDDEFYDELEDLPAPSFFTAFMGSGFIKERILVDPS